MYDYGMIPEMSCTGECSRVWKEFWIWNSWWNLRRVTRFSSTEACVSKAGPTRFSYSCTYSWRVSLDERIVEQPWNRAHYSFQCDWDYILVVVFTTEKERKSQSHLKATFCDLHFNVASKKCTSRDKMKLHELSIFRSSLYSMWLKIAYRAQYIVKLKL